MWSSGARAIFEGIRDRVMWHATGGHCLPSKAVRGRITQILRQRNPSTSWEQWHILRNSYYSSGYEVQIVHFSILPPKWAICRSATIPTGTLIGRQCHADSKELCHMISSKPASGHLDHSNRPMLHQFRRLDPNENASDNTSSPNRAELSSSIHLAKI